MEAKSIYWLIVLILLFGFVLDRILSFLNHRTWEKKLPDDLKEFYDEEKYEKARNYNNTLWKFGILRESLSFFITLGFFMAGGFAWLNNLISPHIHHPVFLTLIYFAVLFFVSDLLSIPFSIYRTFVIEEKFGFNKTTPKTFILDKLKSYALLLIIGGILGFILIWLIIQLKEDFWIYAFLVMTAFSLFFTVFYSSLIIPLFNKLTPLEDGELRTAIFDFAGKVSFPLDNIYVIDGSKRSSKANAFFTGLWKKKKIVLYDTLIAKHTVPELVAVLAHEVGHYKKKHIVKGLIAGIAQTFVMLFIVSKLLFLPELSKAFGCTDYVLHINLIALTILFEPVNLIIGLAGNIFSRKHEYQADKFSVIHTGSYELKNALKKLSVAHLSNLKPHPAYVFFYYSHPPLFKRLQAIENIKLNPS
ncbi:MAG TPA: M48 family metallopeptidase [Bacteroidia bacterium]|nr:M48 family metallopeptidase [Bacteroidia bacterium]HRS58916.1 M48 family metallopeptidase [Bacteroidia bacterium]HRU67412.1 M48 family metallopeptidase [Bacteroidia bacterium]